MSKAPSVTLNKTDTHKISNISFGDLPNTILNEILKDGRAFSHFIEPWLETKYPLVWIRGCKQYDFKDKNDAEILYDEKTFTKGGLKFMPSYMIGSQRTFDKKVFEEKTKRLIFCIVSNINFPEIKVKFVKGEELLKSYPTGKIKLKDHDKFFN